MLFCPSCKKYIEDSSELYCPDCGTRLVSQPALTLPAERVASGSSSFWSQLSKLNPRTKLVIGVVVIAVVIIAAAASAYHPGSGPQGTANLPTKFTHWVAPGEGAFSVLLPDGWTAKGGVQRPDAIDWGLWFNATDRTGTMRVFFVMPSLPLYMDQQHAAGALCSTVQGTICDLNAQFGIGGHTLPSFQVYNYMTAETYGGQLLWNSLKTFVFVAHDSSGPQITTKSDTTQRFAWVTSAGSYSGADVSIAYSSAGSSYRVETNLGLGQTCVLSYCLWSAAFSGASAQQSDFNTVADIYQLVIMPTFRINPQWYLAVVQNGAIQSSMISQFSSKMQQLSYDAFEIQQSGTIQAGQGWINALGGVMNMQDSNGDEYTVPSTIPDANHWWASGQTVVWTQGDAGPSGYSELSQIPKSG